MATIQNGSATFKTPCIIHPKINLITRYEETTYLWYADWCIETAKVSWQLQEYKKNKSR